MRRGWRILGILFVATLPLAMAAPAASLAAGQPQDPASGEVGELTIPLNEYEGSGVSGQATLSAIEGGTRVTFAVEGDALTGDHPTHIHTGTCANFDPNPLYPLTTVILDDLSATGMSDTSVDEVTLDELLDDDFVILVHKSAAELTTYLVCGDIDANAAISDWPSSGVGPLATDDFTSTLGLAAIALAATATAATLIVARRRERMSPST